MSPSKFKLYITSHGRVPNFHDKDITHILSIGDPASRKPYISHYACRPVIHRLEFEDIDIKLLAKVSPTTFSVIPPTDKEISEIIKFAIGLKDKLMRGEIINLLCHCWAGQCRSTAAAYIILNIIYGPGNEYKCLNEVYHARPIMVPNDLMVQIADRLLNLNGALLEPILKYNNNLII